MIPPEKKASRGKKDAPRDEEVTLLDSLSKWIQTY
jgi:hypothetical protein